MAFGSFVRRVKRWLGFRGRIFDGKEDNHNQRNDAHHRRASQHCLKSHSAQHVSLDRDNDDKYERVQEHNACKHADERVQASIVGDEQDNGDQKGEHHERNGDEDAPDHDVGRILGGKHLFLFIFLFIVHDFLYCSITN